MKRTSPPALLLLHLLSVLVISCGPSSSPGDQEEIPTKTEDVPEKVREAAVHICERLGGARCGQWYWDTEDSCWEVTLHGLSRQAELDIETDGRFQELELVYDISEIEKVLPEIAKHMRDMARSETGIFIELSLRREEYLDDIPDLAKAWTMSGVVLEFQCPNGRDFELDPRGVEQERPVDDRQDPSAEEGR